MTENLPPNERPANRSGSPSGALLIGIGLLVVGALLLAENLGLNFGFRFLNFNWWALFILVPGAWIGVRAFQEYQAAGQWTRTTRSHMVWGALLVLLGAAFLFDLSFSLLWPAVLIIGGGALLLSAVRGRA